MNFRTELTPEPFARQWSFGDRFFLLGSCFTESVGEYLHTHGFDACYNPFGNLYNPLSVAGLLDRLAENKRYTEQDLTLFDETYYSLGHAAEFAGSSAEQLLDRLNGIYKTAADHLKNTDVLILTFGSAYAYKWRPTSEIVANCHKIPQTNFTKLLLSEYACYTKLSDTLRNLHRRRPDLRVVLTISPVRYLRDGFEGNSHSKAVLHATVHKLTRSLPLVEYFPSYELLLDDLRDYRFFADDLLHPSQAGVQYIREKLAETAFDQDTRQTVRRLDDLLKAARHRPRNPQSDDYRSFKTGLTHRINSLKAERPGLHLPAELAAFLK